MRKNGKKMKKNCEFKFLLLTLHTEIKNARKN